MSTAQAANTELAKKVEAIMDAPVDEQGARIQALWNDLVGLAKTCAGDHPGVRTSVIAAGATNLQMALKAIPRLPRKDCNNATRKEAAFRALFESDSTDTKHVDAVMELIEKMQSRVNEVVFVWSHSNKKRTEGRKRKKNAKAKDIKPVVVTFGFLFPSSRAFMDWKPIPECDWKEDEEGTEFAALDQLRSDKKSRLEVLKQEKRHGARSLNAAYRAAFTVVHQDREGSEDDDDQNGSEEDEDSDDSSAEGAAVVIEEASRKESEEASPKESRELDPIYCKGFLARIKVNPLIQRLNTTAAKTSERPVLMTDVFRDMKSAWTLCDVNNLVMQIVKGMEGGNIDTAGLLGHISETGAANNAGDAEFCIGRTDVDMTDRKRELHNATAFRLGAFAMVEGAIQETLEVNKMTGVPRQMALSNPKLAKKVKKQLGGLECGQITSNYFSFQEQIAKLTAENIQLKADAGARIAEEAAVSEMVDRDFGDDDQETELIEAALASEGSKEDSGQIPRSPDLELGGRDSPANSESAARDGGWTPEMPGI
jgi:hypothetical protein